MRVLFAAATLAEVKPFLTFLDEEFEKDAETVYHKAGLEITSCITGVGMMQTAFSLAEAFALRKPDFALQAGVAGVFQKKIALGDVVVVGSELLGDLGAEDKGRFLDVFDLGLMPQNTVFEGKALKNPFENLPFKPGLPVVKSLGVNTCSGKAETIEKRSMQYDCAIESMEGAAFHFACLKKKIPFLQVRSVSNDIEPRDKSKWEMGKAIRNLNDWLIARLPELEAEIKDNRL
jgi:futalosine hydrolase